MRVAVALALVISNALASQFADRLLASAARNGRPAHVAADAESWDCAWRTFAAEFSAAAMPWLTAAQTADLADALQLAGLACNATSRSTRAAAAFSAPRPAAPAPGAAAYAAATEADAHAQGASVTVFVDWARGSDANGGSLAQPVKTLAAALALVRAARAAGGGAALPAAVVLRGGHHFLNATIELTPADSFTSFASFPGEAAEVSAGVSVPPAALAWARAQAPLQAGAWTADFSAAATGLANNLSALPALTVNGRRATLARFPNADAERDAFPAGWITSGGTWARRAMQRRERRDTRRERERNARQRDRERESSFSGL